MTNRYDARHDKIRRTAWSTHRYNSWDDIKRNKRDAIYMEDCHMTYTALKYPCYLHSTTLSKTKSTCISTQILPQYNHILLTSNDVRCCQTMTSTATKLSNSQRLHACGRCTFDRITFINPNTVPWTSDFNPCWICQIWRCNLSHRDHRWRYPTAITDDVILPR